MRRHSALAVAGLLTFGCAATTSQMAARAMRVGDYERALPFLTAETIAAPSDARAWARLGEAQYHISGPRDARRSFDKALSLNGSLSTAHLFLGYILEAQDSVDQALFHYRAFADAKTQGPAAAEVTRRIEALRRTRALAFARDALAHEKELKPKTYSDSTIGVVYFNSERLSEPLRPLAKGLAEMLVTDLSKVRGLRVVERLKTERLLDELKWSHTASFDTSTAPRLGKLLGAAHILGGEAAEMSQGRLRFDPALVATKSGDIVETKEQVGELAQFFRIQQQIVLDVLKRLHIEPSAEEKKTLGQAPTESFVAFLAFSRGLNDQDLGMFGEARKEFQKAAALDPSFKAAADHARDMARLASAGPSDQPEKLETFAQNTSGGSEWTEPVVDTDSRLAGMQENIGLLRTGKDDPTPPPHAGTTVIIDGHFDPGSP